LQALGVPAGLLGRGFIELRTPCIATPLPDEWTRTVAVIMCWSWNYFIICKRAIKHRAATNLVKSGWEFDNGQGNVRTFYEDWKVATL